MNALVPFALHGEVLPDKINVRWMPHPFNETRTERHECPAGWTLAEIVDEVCKGREGVRAWADGVRVEPGDWGHTCPARDVTLRYVPGPFLIPLIPVIAAAIGTALIPAAGLVIGTVTISAAVAGAVISVAGALLSLGLSMLFRPSAPKQLTRLNNREPSPTYSISGIGNQANPYGVVPLVLGRHRIYPPFANRPYTEIIGKQQYINCLFILGYGVMDIDEEKLGETAISQFDDAELNIYTYTPGVDLPRHLSNQVDEEVFQISLGTGDDPISSGARTTEANVDAISVDLVAPSGVFAIDISGNDRTHRAKIQIEYREVGASTWTLWAEKELKNKVRGEVIRVGYRWTVDPGQYEVRILRLPYVQSESEFQVQEDLVYWTVLRSHRFAQPVEFDSGLTLAALRIRATDQLSGSIDNFNCIVHQRGWKFTDGGAWVDEALIQSPADIFRTMMTHDANPKPISVENIDFDSLEPWAADCRTNGWEFNQVRDFEASFWDCLSDVCAAGRAMPVVIDGKWGVIWEHSPAVTQAFTPRNTLNFSGERIYETPPHGYRVRFVNELAGWDQDERIVYDDGYDESNAELIEGLELPGISHPDLVWKLGRYHIAQRRLRRELYTIEVDIEQVAARRGDRVRVNHDVPMWGLGFGRVAAIDGAEVTLDEPVTMVGGDTYAIRFRSVDGDNHSDILRTVQTVEGDGQTTVTLTGAGDVPAVGDMFLFGRTDQESVVLRVLSVQPGGDFSARITMVDDAPEVLLADAGTIPPFQTRISTPITARDFAPTDLRVTERVVLEGVQALAELRFSFKPPRLSGIVWHQVQYRAGDDEDWTRSASLEPSQTEFVARVPPGEWLFRVRSHRDADVTAWAEIAHSATAVYDPPPNVGGLRVMLAGDVAILTWDVVSDATQGVEIRHSRELVGATVSGARVLATGIQGATATVPAMSGTYLVRWVSVMGTHSTTAATVSTDAPDLLGYNVVETVDEHPTFAGAKTGLTVASSELSRESEGVGAYDFAQEIDLGAVYPARLEIIAKAFAEDLTASIWDRENIWNFDTWEVPPEDWAVGLYYRSTEDDPSGTPTWSDWREIEVGEVRGRAFQFQIMLTARREGMAVRVTELTAIVDMPDRIDRHPDVVVSAGSATTVAFSPAFMDVPAITHALQGIGVVRFTNKSAAGVDVEVFNTAGTSIGGTVDVAAHGYGRQI